LEFSSSEEVAQKEEIPLSLALGMPDSLKRDEKDVWHNPFFYTRFFLNEQMINPKERIPNSTTLPLRPVAFGDEIVEQVIFLSWWNFTLYNS
jgi:hypothetical protein